MFNNNSLIGNFVDGEFTGPHIEYMNGAKFIGECKNEVPIKG